MEILYNKMTNYLDIEIFISGQSRYFDYRLNTNMISHQVFTNQTNVIFEITRGRRHTVRKAKRNC